LLDALVHFLVREGLFSPGIFEGSLGGSYEIGGILNLCRKIICCRSCIINIVLSKAKLLQKGIDIVVKHFLVALKLCDSGGGLLQLGLVSLYNSSLISERVPEVSELSAESSNAVLDVSDVSLGSSFGIIKSSQLIVQLGHGILESR
jgi:hypothetical protein